VDFPVFDEVPWLVADPDSHRFEWRNRWQLALQQLERRGRNASDALKAAPGEATLARLENLAAGYAAQHRALKALLAPLGLAKPADLETYLALKTRLPSQMGLTSYTTNVFRDWCWGAVENEGSLLAVENGLGDSECSSVLVLGAGAGRLAYDLHQTLSPALTVALELNPFLTTLMQRIVSGERLTLTEFPLAPSNGDCSAIERDLVGPAPAKEGFEVVLADAMRAPFESASFDLILTPWLMDVIDAPPGALLKQINLLLQPGGRWIYHGSLAFDRANVAENLNLEELKSLVGACGFTIASVEEQESVYMNCPDSRHGRLERIVTLSATKVAEVDADKRHQNLPDWIARGREPIPLLPGFQSQAMATRIHAFIMSLIDGKRTLKDMAQMMETQQLMPKDEAETAIRGFLIKMLDEASSGRGL
jgi:SAM-dependent methyltransferase